MAFIFTLYWCFSKSLGIRNAHKRTQKNYSHYYVHCFEKLDRNG